MIFSSVNENGIPAWKMVKNGAKTVTRRLKPQPIGAIRAVQPNRGKKAVCYIEILDCRYETWVGQSIPKEDRHQEAHKEGFLEWKSLLDWFILKYGTDSMSVWRIEFRKLVVSEKI